MKHINIKIITVVAVMIIAVVAGIFYTCKKYVECQTCGREPDAINQVTFNLMDKSYKSEFEIRKFEHEGNNLECVTHSECKDCVDNRRTNENLFQLFKKYCISKNLVVNNQTMAFVLYYDSPISQSFSIAGEYISGISIYNVENNKIIHHLFVKDKKFNFYEIENVKVAVPGITTNHSIFYLENYVFIDPQNKSFIILLGDFFVDEYKNFKKYKETPLQFEVKQRKEILGAGCSLCGGYGNVCSQ